MYLQSKTDLLGVTGTFLGLATIAVALRFYARKCQRMPLKADDIFAFLALVFYIATAAIVFQEVKMKMLGYPYNSLPPNYLKSQLKTMRLAGLFWNVCAALTTSCTKLSVLFFYRRVFVVHGIRQPINALVIGTIVVCVMWALTYIILPFLQCGTHLNAGWKGGMEKYCHAQDPYFLSMVTSNLILDVWLVLVPLPNIIRLQVTFAKKASILGVFLLAFVGIAASIARVVIYFEVTNGGAGYAVTHDLGLTFIQKSYFTMLEAGISLLAVNLPSLWLLMTTTIPQKVVGSLRSVRSRSTMRSNHSGSFHEKPIVVREFEVTSSSDVLPCPMKHDLEASTADINAEKSSVTNSLHSK
ncbi:hypothetical protein K461DRAFT_324553 [Myriangium duriaei CBS 260.36]|uniref:Rhodopsin domain-containing protein n=1 Tax=Myriangium duriaei CBS 260.36 TaxID=1168546 RepID=A0A9P4IYM8_9PEZI|nr:hypothetical protein K461DRAFT_324553 [Myriangium duriaei CBS 260.36]